MTIKKNLTVDEILKKVDSWEINKSNYNEWAEVYKELKYAGYLVRTIQVTFFFTFGYLIGYFLTH